MSRRTRIERRAARAFHLKDFSRAREELRQLLDVTGENPRTLHALALCHARLGESQLALASAERAAALDPADIANLRLIAQLHVAAGASAEARKWVARALAQPPVAEHGLRGLLARLDGSRVDDRRWRAWAEEFLGNTEDP